MGKGYKTLLKEEIQVIGKPKNIQLGIKTTQIKMRYPFHLIKSEKKQQILIYTADENINWLNLSGIQFYPDIPFLEIKEELLIYSFIKQLFIH